MNAAGSEGKLAEEFNHPKVSREDSLLWLAARYGRYDNGNLALSQQSSQNMAGMAMCKDSGGRRDCHFPIPNSHCSACKCHF